MNKETELLIRALEFVERNYVKHPLANDIRAYLNLSEIPTGCEAGPKRSLWHGAIQIRPSQGKISH
jgi:hypothetical protein